MSTEKLFGIAENFEKLVSRGQQHPYQQVSNLNDSAYRLQLVSPLFETAALGHYDPDDIYEEDTDAPARAERVKNLINQINDTTAYMKHKAYKQGLSSRDSHFYKTKLKGLLSELKSPKFTYKKIDPMMISALTNFERKLNEWNALGFKGLTPTPKAAPAPSPYEEQLRGKRRFHAPESHPEAQGDETILKELYE